MNCNRPGELAVVYWPGSSAHNHVVTTAEMIPPNTRFFFCGRERLTAYGPAWWVEVPDHIKTLYGPVRRFPIYDMHLRPIGSPERGGVEQRTFQRPLPTVAEAITGALNRMKFGSRS